MLQFGYESAVNIHMYANIFIYIPAPPHRYLRRSCAPPGASRSLFVQVPRSFQRLPIVICAGTAPLPAPPDRYLRRSRAANSGTNALVRSSRVREMVGRGTLYQFWRGFWSLRMSSPSLGLPLPGTTVGPSLGAPGSFFGASWEPPGSFLGASWEFL